MCSLLSRVCMWEVSQSPEWNSTFTSWPADEDVRSHGLQPGSDAHSFPRVFSRWLSSHGKIQVKMRSVAVPWRWKGIEDKHWPSPFSLPFFTSDWHSGRGWRIHLQQHQALVSWLLTDNITVFYDTSNERFSNKVVLNSFITLTTHNTWFKVYDVFKKKGCFK